MRIDAQVLDGVERHAGFDIAVRHVRRNGPTLGRILFVNGAATTLTALRWAEKGLSEFDLVTFDFPAMGRSWDVARRVSHGREGEASIVRSLVERHGPDHLASLSWGGVAALSVLAERPPSVKRAAVASFAARLSEPLRDLCATLTALIEAGRTEAAAALTVDALGERLPERMKSAFRRFCLELTPDQATHLRNHMLDVMASAASGAVSLLGAIDVPIAFVNGAADRFTPPESARGFEGLVRTATFHIVPGAGHFLALESPERADFVCRVGRDFFSAAHHR